jgi:hypothetical protein
MAKLLKDTKQGKDLNDLVPKIDLNKEMAFTKRGLSAEENRGLIQANSDIQSNRNNLSQNQQGRRLLQMIDSTYQTNPDKIRGANDLDGFVNNYEGEDIKDNSMYGYAMVRGRLVKVPIMINSNGSLLTNSQGDYVGAGGLPVTPVNEASNKEIVRLADAIQSTDQGKYGNEYIKALAERQSIKSGENYQSAPTTIPEFNKRDKSKIKKNFILPDKVPISYRK